MKMVLYLLITSLVSSVANATHGAQCFHFWLNGDIRVKSGRPVGIDVGESPFGTNGVYECSITITNADLESSPYLFIGEVGNSSYFKLLKIDDTDQNFVVVHGLEPEKRVKPFYSRYLP